MVDKSKFTCPYCGGLFGCTPQGQVSIYSVKIYNSHVEKCPQKPKLCKSC